MKNSKFVIVAIAILFSTSLFAQVEDVAKEVLRAYKERNIELLKKNASGILKYAIKDGYFKDKGLQDDLKAVANWDGRIKEVRYKSGKMFGRKIYLASFYFSDAPMKDKIYTVLLSSLDKKKWVMFGSGITTEKKETFEKMSLSFSENESRTPEGEKTRKFTTEMADGSKTDKVSIKSISDSINKLDDENFFYILNRDKDFIQAAYSKKGFTIQYTEKEKQFEAKEYLSKDATIKMFQKYFKGKENWKKSIEWIKVE